METETMSLRRLTMIGIYVLLIFSVLALIRSQSRHLLSSETQSTSVQVSSVENIIV